MHAPGPSTLTLYNAIHIEDWVQCQLINLLHLLIDLQGGCGSLDGF